MHGLWNGDSAWAIDPWAVNALIDLRDPKAGSFSRTRGEYIRIARGFGGRLGLGTLFQGVARDYYIIQLGKLESSTFLRSSWCLNAAM